MILTYFYLSDILNAWLLLVTEYFLQCGISTFTEVKDLNTSSTTALSAFMSESFFIKDISHQKLYEEAEDVKIMCNGLQKAPCGV